MNHFELLGVERDASDDEVRAAYTRLARQFHPDAHPGATGSDARRLHEVMSRINAAYDALRTEERRVRYAATLGADERTHGLRPPAVDECALCGHAAARPCRFRYQAAYVLAARLHTLEAVLCRDCGRAAGRSYQNRTLWLGWWGVIAAFRNLAVVGGNARALYQLSRLGAPRKVAGVAAPLTAPLASGRPLWARSGVWAFAAAVATLTSASVASEPAGPQTGTRFTGSDGTMGVGTGGWRVGACVDITGSWVELSPCSGPHDGVIIDAAVTDTGCPLSAESVIDDPRGGVLCIDET